MGRPARTELTRLHDGPSSPLPPAGPGSDLHKIRRALADLKADGVDITENAPIGDPPPDNAGGGWVSWTDDSDIDAFGRAQHRHTCSDCGGSGRDGDDPQAKGGVCAACQGDGRVTVEADDERASDDLVDDLYLEFGASSEDRARAIARTTVAALRAHGLTVQWNRNLAYSIRIVADSR